MDDNIPANQALFHSLLKSRKKRARSRLHQPQVRADRIKIIKYNTSVFSDHHLNSLFKESNALNLENQVGNLIEINEFKTTGHITPLEEKGAQQIMHCNLYNALEDFEIYKQEHAFHQERYQHNLEELRDILLAIFQTKPEAMPDLISINEDVVNIKRSRSCSVKLERSPSFSPIVQLRESFSLDWSTAK
jgi:hypothetical protein